MQACKGFAMDCFRYQSNLFNKRVDFKSSLAAKRAREAGVFIAIGVCIFIAEGKYDRRFFCGQHVLNLYAGKCFKCNPAKINRFVGLPVYAQGIGVKSSDNIVGEVEDIFILRFCRLESYQRFSAAAC